MKLSKKQLASYGIKKKNVFQRYVSCRHDRKKQIQKLVYISGTPYMNYTKVCWECGRQF